MVSPNNGEVSVPSKHKVSLLLLGIGYVWLSLWVTKEIPKHFSYSQVCLLHFINLWRFYCLRQCLYVSMIVKKSIWYLLRGFTSTDLLYTVLEGTLMTSQKKDKYLHSYKICGTFACMICCTLPSRYTSVIAAKMQCLWLN